MNDICFFNLLLIVVIILKPVELLDAAVSQTDNIQTDEINEQKKSESEITENVTRRSKTSSARKSSKGKTSRKQQQKGKDEPERITKRRTPDDFFESLDKALDQSTRLDVE